MKANELMIGDWVRIKSDIEPNDAYWLHDDMQPGQALKVTEILSDGINPDWCGGEINDYVPEGAIEPIPLTPEILEKNGFRKCEGNEWSFYKYKKEGKGLYNILWSADELYLEIASYTSLTGEFNRMGIKYIHELQHALRLCLIDKEITL